MYVITQVFILKHCFFSLANLLNPWTINQGREFCIIAVSGDWRQYATIPPLKIAFQKLAKPAGYYILWEYLDTVCDIWKDPIEVSVQMRTGLTSEPWMPVERYVIPHVRGRNATDVNPITVVGSRKVCRFRKETKAGLGNPTKSLCSHFETVSPMSIQQSNKEEAAVSRQTSILEPSI
jgi:hypothetical protein